MTAKLLFILISFWCSITVFGQSKVSAGDIDLKIAKNYLANHLYDSTIFYYDEAILNYKSVNRYNDAIHVLYLKSNLYYTIGSLSKAIEGYFVCLKYYKETNETTLLTEILNGLGTSYYRMGELFYAEKYFNEALVIHEKNQDSIEVINIIANLGSIEFSKGNTEKAIEYYSNSCQFKIRNNDLDIAMDYANLGNAYSQLGQVDTGLYFYNLGLESNPIEESFCEINTNIGESYLVLKQPLKATFYFNKVDSVLRITENLSLKVYLLQLEIKAYKELKNWKKTVDLYDNYTEAKDSLFNKAEFQKIAKLQLDYNLGIKESEIAAQEIQIDLLEQEKISQESRNLLNKVLIFLLILFLLLFYFVIKSIRQRKTYLQKESIIQQLAIKNAKFENQELLNKIELNNRQLTTYTLHIFQKNTMLSELLSEIEGSSNNHELIENTLLKIKRKVEKNINIDSDWNDFKLHFERVNPSFFSSIEKTSTTISLVELRHCAYIKMGFDTNEIARLLNILPKSVQRSRVRLKKKLSLSKEQNLIRFLLDL